MHAVCRPSVLRWVLGVRAWSRRRRRRRRAAAAGRLRARSLVGRRHFLHAASSTSAHKEKSKENDLCCAGNGHCFFRNHQNNEISIQRMPQPSREKKNHKARHNSMNHPGYFNLCFWEHTETPFITGDHDERCSRNGTTEFSRYSHAQFTC